MNNNTKPFVCLIDEDTAVAQGWEQTLQNCVELAHFKTPPQLIKESIGRVCDLNKYCCIIINRYYPSLNLDMFHCDMVANLRYHGAGPIYLNWQGYTDKNDLNKFDGKLFHKYGIRWSTLRSRIQKTVHARLAANEFDPEITRMITKGTFSFLSRSFKKSTTKPERCSALLRSMATKAVGDHKKKIEFYAFKNTNQGIELLEALYTRLATDKDRSPNCPSKYINSSPIIAKRILQETLGKSKSQPIL